MRPTISDPPWRYLVTGALLLSSLLPLEYSAADPRSTEIFRYGCSNELGKRELTLFENGTLRLRYGLREDPSMLLAELEPIDLHEQMEKLARLVGEEQSSFAPIELGGVSGDWVETCEAHVDVPGLPSQRARFGKYDVHPLWISRLIQLADELTATFIEPLQEKTLPSPSYEPKVGDLLRSLEGTSFRVVGLTSDGKGVELEGVTAPLRIYITVEHLRENFERWSDSQEQSIQ